MTLSTTSGDSLGIQVSKQAADLFDGTTTNIFTVSGDVWITGLSIKVEDAALDATADAVKWTANPTTGSSVDLCATLDVASDEQGTIYSITGILTDALVGTTAGAVAGMTQIVRVSAGSIDLVSAGDSNNGNTALQTVDLWYLPIDGGATVVQT